MRKERYNISNTINVFLIVATLLFVTIGKSHDVAPVDANVVSASSKKESSSSSKEVVIKNQVIEAVIPFVHVDFSQSIFTLDVLTFFHNICEHYTYNPIAYIDKYLKNLFLFIISPNAP